jgi:hypothetical protein
VAQATSHDLWREACQAYANQLIKEDNVLKGENHFEKKVRGLAR